MHVLSHERFMALMCRHTQVIRRANVQEPSHVIRRANVQEPSHVIRRERAT